MKVVSKSGIHDRPCYQITFDDDSVVVCDNVHLWNVAVTAESRRTGSSPIKTVDALQRGDPERQYLFAVLEGAANRAAQRAEKAHGSSPRMATRDDGGVDKSARPRRETPVQIRLEES